MIWESSVSIVAVCGCLDVASGCLLCFPYFEFLVKCDALRRLWWLYKITICNCKTCLFAEKVSHNYKARILHAVIWCVSVEIIGWLFILVESTHYLRTSTCSPFMTIHASGMLCHWMFWEIDTLGTIPWILARKTETTSPENHYRLQVCKVDVLAAKAIGAEVIGRMKLMWLWRLALA